MPLVEVASEVSGQCKTTDGLINSVENGGRVWWLMPTLVIWEVSHSHSRQWIHCLLRNIYVGQFSLCSETPWYCQKFNTTNIRHLIKSPSCSKNRLHIFLETISQNFTYNLLMNSILIFSLFFTCRYMTNFLWVWYLVMFLYNFMDFLKLELDSGLNICLVIKYWIFQSVFNAK